jgi:hypothetical protein
LSDLVRLGLALVGLNIYARITRPRGFEDMVTTATSTRFPKKILTYFPQIREANPFGILAHVPENFSQVIHDK